MRSRLPGGKALLDFAIVLAGTGFATGTGFILKIFIGRRLGPDALGIFSVCYAILCWLAVVADLGVRYSVITLATQYGEKEPEHARSLVGSSLLLKGAGGFLMFLVGWLLAEPFALNLFHKPELEPFLKITATGIMLWALWDGVEGCLQLRQRFTTAALLRIAMDVCRLVAFFALYFYLDGQMLRMDRYMWLYFLAIGVSLVLGLPLVFAHTKPLFRNLGRSMGELVRFSQGVFFYRLFAILLLFMDSLMLSRYGRLEQVGKFEAAKGLAYALLLVSETLGQVLLPKVNQMRSGADYRSFLARFTRYIGALALAGIVWMFGAGKLLVLFGKQFQDPAVVTTFEVLVFSTLALMPATVMGTVLLSLKRPGLLAIVGAVQVALGFVLYPLACQQDIVQAAYCGATLQGVGAVILWILLYRIVGRMDSSIEE